MIWRPAAATERAGYELTSTRDRDEQVVYWYERRDRGMTGGRAVWRALRDRLRS